jgi:signal transduction histidine kinase
MVGLAGRTVVIVEDEALVAIDLAARLTRVGLQVVGVEADGDAAITLIHRTMPDIVLLDVQLASSTNGFDVARAVTHAGPAVIYLTASADDLTISKASATNPAGYIIKPFDERSVIAAISVALKRRDADNVADSSSRRQAEARLEISQRDEVLWHVARGLAHDFNSELTVIMGSTELMMEQPTAKEFTEDLQLIQRSAARISVLTRQLLDFSRVGGGERIDLGATITQLTPLLTRAARPAALSVEGTASGWSCAIPPSALAQLLVALVVNARDATSGSAGRLTLAISAKDGRVRVVCGHRDRGMQEDVADQVPEALMLVQTIAQSFGGTVQVAGGAPMDVRVRVELPARPDRFPDVRQVDDHED